VKEIASKLGLGIGEVKLVIDLFSEVRLWSYNILWRV
jgi:hypothetical protein